MFPCVLRGRADDRSVHSRPSSPFASGTQSPLPRANVSVVPAGTAAPMHHDTFGRWITHVRRLPEERREPGNVPGR